MSDKTLHPNNGISHVTGDSSYTARRGSSPPKQAERDAVSKFMRLAGNPNLKVRLWDGEELSSGDKPPVATLIFHERSALYKFISKQDVAFGDEFSAGRIEVEGDLVDFLVETYRANDEAKQSNKTYKTLSKLVSRRPRINTLSGSKKNIHHHYDIGNEFYQLWLDEEMQYTCAYYPRADMTVEEAQQAKLHHVCRKLQLKPGDRVVEAGCGWGGLARHMAKYYGAKVKAYNISREQVRFATERAEREGYATHVEYIEDDYRNAKGACDVFVSIGMLEHVGTQHYPDLGAVIDRCLTANGRMLIHTIGRNQPRLMNAWIEKRIFPGAYPPTLKEMMGIFEPYNFSILDVENLRLHYAKTLGHWLERYDKHEEQISQMFDQNFVRAWRLYLAGSIAAFLHSSLQLFQVVAARGRDNSVPWNREHLYKTNTPEPFLV